MLVHESVRLCILWFQEYWIKYKYSEKAAESLERAVIATKNSFHDIKFMRHMPKGSKCKRVLISETKMFFDKELNFD